MTIFLFSPKRAAVVLAFGLGCLTVFGETSTKKHPVAKPILLTKRERAEHALNRLTFGPHPGEVERVEKVGVGRWIDRQLLPERIDDSALEAKMAAFPAMDLSLEELIRRYPPNPVIRQVDAGRISIPVDPVEHAIYSNALANYRRRREQNGKKSQVASQTGGSSPDQIARATAEASSKPGIDVAIFLREPVTERWHALLTMPPGMVRSLLQYINAGERKQLIAGMTPEQKEVLLALAQPDRVVEGELLENRLLRAVDSNRQLDEVMTNFWLNHFNIYLRNNGVEPWYLVAYERDVIRPHALGKFEDLLNAVAHSPAMLVYLDNQQSIGPHSVAALQAGMKRQQKNASPGLNENYARELMELHTVGVNGGYTQRDVIEVAKVLTGWGVEAPQQGYRFEFNERRHEPGPKAILGQTICESGEKEGIEMLHMLATSPATAHFLSAKLAIQFVSDTPPTSLVSRMTKTYLKTHGDIRQVLRIMFRSPEFWSRYSYRAKLKTPLEFVASSLRATDANIENETALVASLNRLGMPLYGVQQPNGYSLTADPWLGAEALLERMNFALSLMANRIPGVRVNLSPNIAPTTRQEEQHLEQVLLDGQVASHTRDVILEQMELAETKPVTAPPFVQARAGKRVDLFAPVALRSAPMSQSNLAAALLLGSPDFQRR